MKDPHLADGVVAPDTSPRLQRQREVPFLLVDGGSMLTAGKSPHAMKSKLGILFLG